MCISDSESGDYIVNSGACSSEDLNDMKYLVTNQQLTTGKVKHFFHYNFWTSIIFNQLRHIRIMSIYAEETTFSVHWSASRVTNLCKDPWDWHRVGGESIHAAGWSGIRMVQGVGPVWIQFDPIVLLMFRWVYPWAWLQIIKLYLFLNPCMVGCIRGMEILQKLFRGS